jgi:Skp family chaperone for outer membrane proteins
VRKLLASVAVLGSALVSSPAAYAQAQPGVAPAPGAGAPSYSANAGRYGMAVVDISWIFKNYPKFTGQIEMLKTEMKTADDSLKSIVDGLTQMEQKRDAMKPGSAEFKQIDEELARQKAEFSIKQGTVRRDFLEREARIYYSTYMEVSAAVKAVAERNNIGMVLRFNGDPIDPQQREDVMRAIMQPIVFQNNVDITPDVLALLNRGAGPVSPAGGVAPGGAPTAGLPAVRK